jgi:hypothetical protein
LMMKIKGLLSNFTGLKYVAMRSISKQSFVPALPGTATRVYVARNPLYVVYAFDVNLTNREPPVDLHVEYKLPVNVARYGADVLFPS